MALTASCRELCFPGRRLLLCAVLEIRELSFKHTSTLRWFAACYPPVMQRLLLVPLSSAFHTTTFFGAGHNKWSKVKNVKGPKDAARSRMFLKFSLLIRHAVKEGGPNPKFNTQLANIIEQCRTQNMPKTSIDAAIKGADKSKAATYTVYEGRGPGGSSFLIEVLTDNNARSLQQLKYIAGRNGGSLCDGARHFFDKKGVVTVNGLDSANQMIELDKALEIAIEAGAEDVQQAEDDDEKPILKFICELSTLSTVREKLNTLGMQTLSVGPEFIPNTMVQLSDLDLEAASLLINMIDNCPDVVRVFDNIESNS